MILAALQTGEAGYAGAAVALRAAYYTGSLGGAGLAFFALLFGARQEAADAARVRRWAAGAALLGIGAGVGALAAQVGVLTGGETLLDADIWGVAVASRAGISYALGGAGLLLVALLGLGRRWAVPAALGGLLAAPARRGELGAAGRAYWQVHLTPEAAARRALALYEQVLGERA